MVQWFNGCLYEYTVVVIRAVLEGQYVYFWRVSICKAIFKVF